MKKLMIFLLGMSYLFGDLLAAARGVKRKSDGEDKNASAKILTLAVQSEEFERGQKRTADVAFPEGSELASAGVVASSLAVLAKEGQLFAAIAANVWGCPSPVSCIETLIAGGVNVNCRDCQGRTPLFALALQFNDGPDSTVIMNKLLKASARVNDLFVHKIYPEKRWTPLDQLFLRSQEAEEIGNNECVTMINNWIGQLMHKWGAVRSVDLDVDMAA